MKQKTVVWLTVLITVAVLLFFVAGWRIVDAFHPVKSSARAVVPGMTRTAVVKSLGAMYDHYPRGQDTSVDQIISTMDGGERVELTCCWKIAGTWERFWVGFDSADVVVETLFESDE